MNRNLEFIKKSLNDMVLDKIDNMCGSEISDEVAELLEGKESLVAEAAYELLSSNGVINTIYNFKAMDNLDYDLIEDWDMYDEFEELDDLDDEIIDNCSTETMDEISYDALYNYDALWMTAIQKAFPDKVTNVQCGWGMIEMK